MNGGTHYWRSPDGTIGVRPLEESGRHCGRLTAGGVRMVLRKLGRSGEFRKMPHKVGSRKSPRRVGLLRTSIGVILYPTNILSIKLCLRYIIMYQPYWLLGHTSNRDFLDDTVVKAQRIIHGEVSHQHPLLLETVLLATDD